MNQDNQIKVKLRNKKINKEFLISFIFSIVSAFIGFIFSFIVARQLESTKYGELQYYLSIISLLQVFMTFGSDTYLIKNLQFAKEKKGETTKIFIFSLIMSAITLPIYFVIAFFLLDKLEKNLVIIFCIYTASLLVNFATIICAIFVSKSKNYLSVFISGIFPHIVLLTLFLIHYFTNTLNLFLDWYLYYYISIYAIISIPFFIYNLKVIKFVLDKKTFITLMIFFLTTLTYSTTTPIANIFIGETYDKFNVVGIFSISAQCIKVARLSTGIITNMSKSSFAKLALDNDFQKLKKFYQSITRLCICISVPFFIAFIVESNKVLTFFGETYGGYGLILILLSVNAIIEEVTGPTGSILLMSGMEKENFFISVGKFILYILLLMILINFTIFAAPIAAIIASLFSNIAKIFIIFKQFHSLFFDKKVYLFLLAIALISALSFFGLNFIENKILWVISNCIVGLVLILGTIFLSPFKKDKEFLFMDKENYIQRL